MKNAKHGKNIFIKRFRQLILILIVLILLYMGYGIYKEGKFRTITDYADITKNGGVTNNSTLDMSNILNDENTFNDYISENAMPLDEEISEKYKGYKVSAMLDVPKINLKTNVLEDYTKNGLEVCASKYYGPEPNEVGNYCIAGHNYQKENMFNHLIDLEIGDSMFLSDNVNGKVEYTIYDIYKVKPQNVEPLSQDTADKREITLITCVNYSRNRLIIKAIQK